MVTVYIHAAAVPERQQVRVCAAFMSMSAFDCAMRVLCLPAFDDCICGMHVTVSSYHSPDQNTGSSMRVYVWCFALGIPLKMVSVCVRSFRVSVRSASSSMTAILMETSMSRSRTTGALKVCCLKRMRARAKKQARAKRSHAQKASTYIASNNFYQRWHASTHCRIVVYV